MGRCVGVDEQGHGDGFFGLAYDEDAGASERSVQVRHARGVTLEAHIESCGSDEPGPFFPWRVAESASLLLACLERGPNPSGRREVAPRGVIGGVGVVQSSGRSRIGPCSRAPPFRCSPVGRAGSRRRAGQARRARIRTASRLLNPGRRGRTGHGRLCHLCGAPEHAS